MKTVQLSSITRLYFGYGDVARALDISPESARVTVSRYVARGLLVRVKRDMYVLRERWNAAGREEKFQLANMGQVPSYISLMTALDYYEITTQMPREFIESVAVKRTKEIQLPRSVFRYTRIFNSLYFGFSKHNGFFIATPEKAFLDSMYLMSLGRYHLDVASLDGSKIKRGEIKRMLSTFPLKTKILLEKHGYL
jgi:predicted transcriptional regulator of viral defense system